MKTSKWMLLINPFNRIAGWKAFAIGIAIMALSVFVGSFSKLYFDGAIDAHFGLSFNWKHALYYQLTGYLCLVACFYLATTILSKGVRLQDIMGTVALSRYPFLLIALFGFLIDQNAIAEIAQNVMSGKIIPSQILALAVISIALLIPIIWSLILLFNAYKVSSGLKSTKLISSFFVALFIAEVVSKLLGYCISMS